jgi:hypothetical protein
LKKHNYSSDWIYKLQDQIHWQFYWHQQKLLEGNIEKKEKIAEVGVGSGFSYNYLKSKGFNMTSIDIDPEKKPDIVANVINMDASTLKFDCLLGFNVFEHMPYEDFLEAVDRLFKGGIKKIFIALPLNLKVILELKLVLGRWTIIDKLITIKRNKITAKFHHWELEYNKYTTAKLLEDILDKGYECRESFRFRRQSYFYFHKKEA